MSKKYAESNNENVMELFYKRQIYVADANNDEYYIDENTNLVNFEVAEKFLYGRVDRHYVPIILNTATTPLGALPASAEQVKTVFQAPAYVVDAFKDLSYQFQKSLMAKKISNSQEFLTTLTLTKAYEDPQKAYYNHSVAVEDATAKHYAQNGIKFKNFDEFLIHFMGSLEKTAHQLPITFPAFVKSRYCPITCSGLALEIADLSFSNDKEKIDSFVNSANWSFYLNACRTYGFSVDRRNPFRLVADIGSSAMLEYSRRYGLNSTDKILMIGYRQAHNPFYRSFVNFLLKYYNKLKMNTYIEVEYCLGGKTIQHIVNPITYSIEELEKHYPKAFFLDLYLEIRFMEEESEFTAAERRKIIDDCKELQRIRDTDTALNIFERILNKTYDYSGSLTNRFKSAILGIEAE